MRKLSPIDDDSYDFAKKIIDQNAQRHLKPEYTRILNNISNTLTDYDRLFKTNTLQNVATSNLNKDDANRFRTLYKSDRKEISRLEFTVLKDNNGITNNICPICGIGFVNSIDHFIPEGNYPEYCVHPRNLIPTCIDCNNPKRARVITEQNERYFWNVYIDNIPDKQFLFCDIIQMDSEFRPRFYVKNDKGIDRQTFELIKRTYDDMHICERYDESSNSRLCPFIASMASHKAISDNEVKQYIDEEINAHEVNDFFMVYIHAITKDDKAFAWFMKELQVIHKNIIP